MKVILCRQHGGPEVLRIEEIAPPEPGPGEVLIRTEAIGVNFVDTMRRSGRHPAAPQPPFTPGIELCGRIAAVGSSVRPFQVGERVIGRCLTHGAYAELVCVQARFAVSCPEELSAAEAAALFVNGQTAWHALGRAGALAAGQSVLITAAAGGVGLCAVQLARGTGAHVIAAASTAAKRELTRHYGAHVVVDYTRPDWPDRVREATEGHGADLILESVGGPVAQACLDCWAEDGRMVIYGQASGQPARVTGEHLLFGHRTACGLAVGRLLEDEDLLRRTHENLVQMRKRGALRLHVGRTYSLEEAAQAHRDLEGRRTSGKLILVP